MENNKKICNKCGNTNHRMQAEYCNLCGEYIGLECENKKLSIILNINFVLIFIFIITNIAIVFLKSR